MADPLEQLTQALSNIRDMAATRNATASVLNQISASLADVVALLEKPHDKADAKEEAAAMAAAFAPLIKGLPAPQVSVTTPPATVTVQKDNAGQQWRIEIERKNPSAPINALVITRL